MGTTPLGYPSVEQVLNLARVRLNDAFSGATGTPGEGRIFTDSAPQALPSLNAAILTLAKDLSNGGVKALREEEVILNIPPLNSAATGGGVGLPDPALQQQLSFAGFFDGSNQTPAPALPLGLVIPNELWQRPHGSEVPFNGVQQAEGALKSIIQGYNLGEWEWRGNSIFWNGGTVALDVRLRYTAGLAPIAVAPSLFPTTYISFLGSLNALAYQTAYVFASSMTAPTDLTALRADYQAEVDSLILRAIRLAQAAPSDRGAFGASGDLFGWYG